MLGGRIGERLRRNRGPGPGEAVRDEGTAGLVVDGPLRGGDAPGTHGQQGRDQAIPPVARSNPVRGAVARAQHGAPDPAQVLPAQLLGADRTGSTGGPAEQEPVGIERIKSVKQICLLTLSQPECELAVRAGEKIEIGQFARG